MIMSLLTPPAGSPITLEEAKSQARVEVDTDDVLIEGFIASATQYAEQYTQRSFMAQQWEMILDHFPRDDDELEIPLPPLQSVDEIAYLDTSGSEVVWDASNYRVIAPAGPFAAKGRVILRNGHSWPTSVLAEDASVFVRFTSGYGDHDQVPPVIRTALQMHVAEMYENRESTILSGAVQQEVPFSVQTQLWPFVVDKFGV